MRWMPPLCLALLAGPAEAGWVQPEGAHYLKVWDQLLVGGLAFGTAGETLELPGMYMDHALRVYFEYGLEPSLTLVLRGVPLGLSVFDGEALAYAGPLVAGLRAGLVKGAFPFAIELSYGYGPPLGARALAEGVIEGQRFRVRPAFEQHLAQAEAQLGWAAPFGWAKASAGVVVSSAGDVGAAFEGALRVGSSTEWGLEGDLGLVLHLPFRALELIDVLGVGATRYLGLGGGVGYWITPHLSVRLDLGTAPFAESNAATPSIALGVATR